MVDVVSWWLMFRTNSVFHTSVTILPAEKYTAVEGEE